MSQIFNKNLQAIISDKKLNLTYQDINQQIVDMRLKYGRLFFSHSLINEEDGVYSDELDLIIMVLMSQHRIIFQDLIDKKLKIYHENKLQDKQQSFELVAIKLVEFLIYDVTTLRNLFIQGLENQFLVVYRSFVDKLNIFYLFMYDYEFALVYANNPENLDGRMLFEKHTNSKQVMSKIKANYKKIVTTEKETRRITGRNDKLAYEFLIDTEKSRKTLYALCNNFTHFSDGKSIMEYHSLSDSKGSKAFLINIAYEKFAAKTFRYHIRGFLELLYFNQSMIMETFRNRASIEKLSLSQLPMLIGEYLSKIIIDRNYNNKEI